MIILNTYYVSTCYLFIAVPAVQATAFTETIRSVHVTRSDGLGINSTDEFRLAALNTSVCNDHVQLKTKLGADCMASTQQSGPGLCFLDCRCADGKSSFILSERQCVDERTFREGCNFVFGSWTWSRGWTWNSLDDSLQTLYLEDGYGFTSGFNVSTSTFSECTITAMAIYDENGEWKPLTIPSEESIITFYKLRGMWHLSWIIEDLSTSKADEIEGRFIKFDITCGSENSVNGSVEVFDQSSCVVFKVTGNLTHQYNATTLATSSTPTYQTSSPIPQTTRPIVQTSSLTAQVRSVMAHTTTPIVQTNSPVVPTSGPTFHTSSPTVKTSSVAVQTSSPMVQSSSTTFHTRSPTAQTIQTSTPTNKTVSPTLEADDLEIGVIVGGVVGGCAMAVILAAVAILTISHFKDKHTESIRLSTNIPLRYRKQAVLPQSV